MNDKYSGNLLVIVGPTAVGKTELSLQLAKRFNGEIISGDSMQVYRRMDIGTAKVSIEERQIIQHHLVDIIEPHEAFSVADFQRLALEAIATIQSKGKLPILVGGTGLYVKSVLYYPQYSFADRPRNNELRDRWEQFAATYGAKALWEEAHKVDPISTTRLHPNDKRRLIRILELSEQKHFNNDPSYWQGENMQSPFHFYMIGLTMPREMLYARINSRVTMMMEDGLADEVKKLIEELDDIEVTSMQSLGYKEMIPYLHGEVNLEDTIALIQKRTRQFAKRQLTWFRHMPEIEWFDNSLEQMQKNLSQIMLNVAGKFENVENT